MYTRTLAVLNFAFYNGVYAVDVTASALQVELAQAEIKSCDLNALGAQWRQDAMDCWGDSSCRERVDADFEQAVCECDSKWIITWRPDRRGYGASYSSSNPERDCGGGAATPEPESASPPAPEPDSASTPAPEPEQVPAASTPAGASDYDCDDAPALDWSLVDAAANGEGSVSEQCRNLNFQLRQLEKHNEYRALHGADPLDFDPDLADDAQAWAEHLDSLGRMYHARNLRDLG